MCIQVVLKGIKTESHEAREKKLLFSTELLVFFIIQGVLKICTSLRGWTGSLLHGNSVFQAARMGWPKRTFRLSTKKGNDVKSLWLCIVLLPVAEGDRGLSWSFAAVSKREASVKEQWQIVGDDRHCLSFGAVQPGSWYYCSSHSLWLSSTFHSLWFSFFKNKFPFFCFALTGWSWRSFPPFVLHLVLLKKCIHKPQINFPPSP